MRLLQVAIAVTLLGSGGCSGTEPANVRLFLTLDKHEVTSADSVQLTMTLVNLSPRIATVASNHGYPCPDRFELVDALGRQASTTSINICALINSVLAPPVPLKPGEQIVIRDWWRPALSTVNDQPLMPGVYRLRGRWMADGRIVRSSFEAVNLQVQTAPAQRQTQ